MRTFVLLLLMCGVSVAQEDPPGPGGDPPGEGGGGDDFDPENPPPKGCCDCIDSLATRIADLSELWAFDPDLEEFRPTEFGDNYLKDYWRVRVPSDLNWFTDSYLEVSFDLNKTLISSEDSEDDDFLSAAQASAGTLRTRIQEFVQLFVCIYGVIAIYSHLLLLKG